MTYSMRPVQAGPSSVESDQGLANRKLYWAIAGGLVLALAAGVALRLATARSTPTDASGLAPAEQLSDDASATASQEALVPATGQAATPFAGSQPFLRASAPLRLADPGMLRSTSPQARVEAVAAGRPDPFAGVVVPGPRPARPTPMAVAPPAIAAQSLPTVPVSATQSLPPLPETVTLPTLPAPFLPGSVPALPTDVAVAPTDGSGFQSLVDQVVVSGVVQVGSGVSVIVTEPGSTASRRVSQGDLLAGGRIRVKAVDLSGQEPVVVLTYNGRDYTRSVGTPLASAL